MIPAVIVIHFVFDECAFIFRASVNRLQSQHERTLLELEAEEELEAKITQTLDQAE